MQPRSQAEAEADRLLGIAENLLEQKDLNAARDFALLAQETEPLLDGSDQIMAITDVLIAANKQINDNHHHWYDILQIDVHQTDDPEFVKQQYLRLALLLHPDKNKFSFSGDALKLVGDAWSVLSDPKMKTTYDKELFEFLNLDLDTVNNWSEKEVQNQPEKIPVRRNFGNKLVGNAWSVSSDSSTKTPYDKELFENLNSDLDAVKNRSEKEVQNQPEKMSAPLLDPSTKTAYGKELLEFLNIDLDALNNRNVKEVQYQREKIPVRRNSGKEGASENLWTPCPYCYYLYEYPRVLEGYCLRCQNCDRAFQVVAIPTEALPPTEPGKEAYCCSWPYFPIGFRISVSDRMPNVGTVPPAVHNDGFVEGAPSESQPPPEKNS